MRIDFSRAASRANTHSYKFIKDSVFPIAKQTLSRILCISFLDISSIIIHFKYLMNTANRMIKDQYE